MSYQTVDADGQHPFTLFCSFCGIWHEDVEKLIIGPGVSICSDCVEACQKEMHILRKNKLAYAVKKNLL